jgi:hypothetical protein
MFTVYLTTEYQKQKNCTSDPSKFSANDSAQRKRKTPAVIFFVTPQEARRQRRPKSRWTNGVISDSRALGQLPIIVGHNW